MQEVLRTIHKHSVEGGRMNVMVEQLQNLKESEKYLDPDKTKIADEAYDNAIDVVNNLSLLGITEIFYKVEFIKIRTDIVEEKHEEYYHTRGEAVSHAKNLKNTEDSNGDRLCVSINVFELSFDKNHRMVFVKWWE